MYPKPVHTSFLVSYNGNGLPPTINKMTSKMTFAVLAALADYAGEHNRYCDKFINTPMKKLTHY